MAEHPQNNQASKQATMGGNRCEFGMRGSDLCERSIHHAPPDVDKMPLCLMHSHDPNKSREDFQAEVERILEKAGEGKANFFGFVFPSTNYVHRTFKAACDFGRVVFALDANFSYATFAQEADFYEATFTHDVTFLKATFTQAKFTQAKFTQDADFRSATFTNKAEFVSTEFTTSAKFRGAEFTQDAAFRNTKFEQNADFEAVNFRRDADFKSATFARRASFASCDFAQAASFLETKFKPDSAGADREPCPDFTNATFEAPGRMKFYRTSFRHALFHKCDVSNVEFSNVEWPQRKNGKSMVFEENIPVKEKEAEALRPLVGDPNDRNYRLIAELYQRLKKYYDDRRDYWTAGDFHYGELEMKRLYSPRKNKVLRWLHRNLGLVACYKYASEYGESYVRPALWVVAVLLIFALLYPATGLRVDPSRGGPPAVAAKQATDPCTDGLSYWCLGPDVPNSDSVWRARVRLFGHGCMTSLYVAAFQKDLTYEPSYWRGRLLALIEVLLTSTLGALFLLAVRRQFKR